MGVLAQPSQFHLMFLIHQVGQNLKKLSFELFLISELSYIYLEPTLLQVLLSHNQMLACHLSWWQMSHFLDFT